MVVVLRVIVAAPAIVGTDDAAKRTHARVQANVLDFVDFEGVRLLVRVTSGTGRVPAPPAHVGECPPREATWKLVIARTSERSRAVTHQWGIP